MKPKLWPIIVVALLGSHIGLMAWAVTKCVGDKNAAVIPDYYEKAVHYDEYKTMRARAAAAAAEGLRP